MAHSYVQVRRVRKQNLEYVRKTRRRWSRRLVRAGLPIEQRVYCCDYRSHVPSTDESDEDDLDYGARIDRADQRDHSYQKGLVHQSLLNHGLKEHTILGKGDGKIAGGEHS